MDGAACYCQAIDEPTCQRKDKGRIWGPYIFMEAMHSARPNRPQLRLTFTFNSGSHSHQLCLNMGLSHSLTSLR
jgi:hypothetical protein